MSHPSRSRYVPARFLRPLACLACLLALTAVTGCGGSSTSKGFNYVGNEAAATGDIPMRYAAKPADAVPKDKDSPAPKPEESNTENYQRIHDNPFLAAETNPIST